MKNFKNTNFWMIVLILLTWLPYRMAYLLSGYGDNPLAFQGADWDWLYYKQIMDILEGRWPEFCKKLPGFILVATPLYAFGGGGLKGQLFIVLFNMAGSLLSLIYFYLSCAKCLPKYKIAAGLVLACYAASPIFVAYELQTMTDSIYTSLAFCVFATLLRILYNPTCRLACILGVFILGLASFRSVGYLALLFIAALLIPYQKDWKKWCLSFVPAICFMLIMVVYNGWRSNVWSVNADYYQALPISTWPYWVEKENNDPFVNKCIREAHKRLTDDEREAFYGDYTFKNMNHMRAILIGKAVTMFEVLLNPLANEKGMQYYQMMPIMKKISCDAIKERPDIYSKFFLSSLRNFFIGHKMLDRSTYLEFGEKDSRNLWLAMLGKTGNFFMMLSDRILRVWIWPATSCLLGCWLSVHFWRKKEQALSVWFGMLTLYPILYGVCICLLLPIWVRFLYPIEWIYIFITWTGACEWWLSRKTNACKTSNESAA